MRLPLIALALSLMTVSDTYARQEAPTLGGRTTAELSLSLGVLAFGLLVMGMQVFVMLRTAKGWDMESTRIVGLTLVVVAGLFLITAGYSQDQIAPMIGLLGTIAGYLLGKTTSGPSA
jgi:hypothetical protein